MRTVAYILVLASLIHSVGRTDPGTEADYLVGLAPELFPQEIEVGEFELGKVIRFYEPENLFEYIDGRASLYRSYGFRRLAHGEYRAAERRDKILLDIYDMRGLRSGFGIYAAERNPSLSFRRLGTQGYIEGTSCNFFQGRLYVKIEAEGDGDDLAGAVEKLAGKVAEKLPGKNSWPEELSFLPEIDKLPDSEEYLPSALLGYKFLGDGFTARYGFEGTDEPARLFFTTEMEPAQARRTFEELGAAWGGRQTAAVDFLPEADTVLVGEAPYLGAAVIFLTDNRVCGLVGPGADSRGREIVKSLLELIGGR